MQITRYARKWAWQLALALSRAFAVVSLTAIAIANLGKLWRSDVILFYPDGGFGHTLISPDWLRRLHPATRNLIFFGTYPRHHNLLVGALWKPLMFVWVWIGFRLPGGIDVVDVAWSYRIFAVFDRIVRKFAPKKICYFGLEGLMSATPRPHWLAAGSFFDMRHESRYYTTINTRPAQPIHVSKAVRRRVERQLADRFGTVYPRRCALYIRHRGAADGEDLSSFTRLSAPFEAYLPAVKVLNDAGYQVLVTGDTRVPMKTAADMKGGVVDWRSSGVEPDDFLIYAGTEADIHIGNLSGGSAYLYVTDIPGLMLNAFPFGDSLPKTTVHYKRLYETNGSLVAPDQLFTKFFFDHDCSGYRLEDASPDELAEVVRDFIEHCHDQRPYGVDPSQIGLDAPWFRAADARLSPVWLANFDHLAQGN